MEEHVHPEHILLARVLPRHLRHVVGQDIHLVVFQYQDHVEGHLTHQQECVLM